MREFCQQSPDVHTHTHTTLHLDNGLGLRVCCCKQNDRYFTMSTQRLTVMFSSWDCLSTPSQKTVSCVKQKKIVDQHPHCFVLNGRTKIVNGFVVRPDRCLLQSYIRRMLKGCFLHWLVSTLGPFQGSINSKPCEHHVQELLIGWQRGRNGFCNLVQ